MSNGKKPSKVWRGLTAISASLLALLIGGNSIATANAAFLNTRLGTSNVEYVDPENNPNTTYFKSDYASIKDIIEAKNALAEQISEEGCVLFKNNGALPIAASDKITLWGANSHYPTLGGMIGSSATYNKDEGQPCYDFEKAFTEKGLSLNTDMIDFYASEAVAGYVRKAGHGVTPSFGMTFENPAAYNVGEIPASEYSDAVMATADNTVGVVILSRDSSEAADYEVTMTSANEADSFERPLALSQNEKDMIELAKAHSTKVIVLLNTSCPMEIDDLKKDDGIGAILWVGHPGINGALGVADVLTGEANPSGHISDTYAVNSASSPAMVNWGVYMYTNNSKSGAADALTQENKADWYIVEGEGIYTGYKYYETRYEDAILGKGNADSDAGSTSGGAWDYASEVSYPFGYGLSYTTFEQTLDAVDVQIGGESTATVTVTNTGDVAGKSVAQLYVQTPYTEGGVEKSAIQLVGFEKTDILEPGASQTLTVPFDAAYFASYDNTAVKADGTTGAWSLEAGDYYFAIGNGAHEALNNVLAKKTGSEDNLVKIADTDVIAADNAVVWTLDATDIETYSVNVQNQLDTMDLNHYIEGTVEYTTRSDWTKGWTPVESITPTEEMMVGLRNANYEFTENGEGVTWGADNGLTILEMMTVDADGNYESVPDINDPVWQQLVEQVTLDEAIQFIEKGGDDVENIDSILLTRCYANDGPLGFAFDQVAGYAVRWSPDSASEATYTTASDECANYAMTSFPTDPIVAATFNKVLAQQEGELFGEDALWANESSIFAPGVNMHRTPYCARNHEYYSEDGVLTSYIGSAVCQGGESKGLMMEPKHFAFNHQETNRSGVSTFMNEQGAREGELRCFQMIMSNNYASGIMTAFNRAGVQYVGGYAPVLINIARNEWGYTGWYNTDMINGADYMNWRDVTIGGGGNCLTSSAYDTSVIGTMAASKGKIEKDTEFQKMMQYNLKFWLYNLAKSNSMNGVSQTTEIHKVLTWYQKAIYAAIAVAALLTLLFAVLGLKKYSDYKKG